MGEAKNSFICLIKGMIFRFLTFFVICHVTKLTIDFEQPRRLKNTMATKTDLRAFVVGYTGQIGRKLVDELTESGAFSHVKLIGRREIEDLKTEKYAKCTQHVVDFDDLPSHTSAFEGLDIGFCTLGTTRGKSGVEGFKKIDFDYVVATAKAARGAGASQFHLVTSQGANKDSSFLYPQTKGLVEEAVKEVGFDRFYVYRPSFLIDSNRPETRVGEVVAHCVLFPVIKLFPTAMSVPIGKVAKTMSIVAMHAFDAQAKDAPYERIFDNKQIHLIADGNFDL